MIHTLVIIEKNYNFTTKAIFQIGTSNMTQFLDKSGFQVVIGNVIRLYNKSSLQIWTSNLAISKTVQSIAPLVVGLTKSKNEEYKQ